MIQRNYFFKTRVNEIFSINEIYTIQGHKRLLKCSFSKDTKDDSMQKKPFSHTVAYTLKAPQMSAVKLCVIRIL